MECSEWCVSGLHASLLGWDFGVVVIFNGHLSVMYEVGRMVDGLS